MTETDVEKDLLLKLHHADDRLIGTQKEIIKMQDKQLRQALIVIALVATLNAIMVFIK